MTSSYPRPMGAPPTDFEDKLTAFRHAQILIDEGEPNGFERLREAMEALSTDLPPCPWCNADIRDVTKAVVVKDRRDTPSRLLHAECAADEFDAAVGQRALFLTRNS